MDQGGGAIASGQVTAGNRTSVVARNGPSVVAVVGVVRTDSVVMHVDTMYVPIMSSRSVRAFIIFQLRPHLYYSYQTGS